MSKDAAQVHPSKSREIPSRRVILSDPSQIPSDYSSTPGGTIFSTTPGGTRIIYERSFLMQMRNSPLAKTPPKNLPTIPGVTSPAENVTRKPKHEKNKPNHHPPNQENHDKDKPMDLDEPQFEMDI